MTADAAIYRAFIERKRRLACPAGLRPVPVPGLYGFQQAITNTAVSRGRCAIFADCGLGKTRMALAWAKQVSESTARPVLILTPLAVAPQFVAEGRSMGVDVRVARRSMDGSAIQVANYERLHLMSPRACGGVVLDESSILKNHTAKTRTALIESFADTPFRLCCTATPAPNDYIELGNHAEFLGMMSRSEMLAMYFNHDGGSTQNWRLRGHARRDFWRWVASWSATCTQPSDVGPFADDDFQLPPISVRRHMVAADHAAARDRGLLFLSGDQGVSSASAARRSSIRARVARTVELVSSKPRDPWVVWCDYNDESQLIARAIDGAVEVTGSLSVEEKEARLIAFGEGRARIMVTKPAIAGWGLNWQHCADVVFAGLSFSFESFYQAVRRTHRFGQRRPVTVNTLVSDADACVAAVLERKMRDAEEMRQCLISAQRDLARAGG